MRRVDASIRKHKALHWNAANKVRVNDFLNIIRINEAVPDRLGIDDDCRTMLALIHAGLERYEYRSGKGIPGDSLSQRREVTRRPPCGVGSVRRDRSRQGVARFRRSV